MERKIMSRYCPPAAQHEGCRGGQESEAPVSKTYTYKKITKPLLERKRRARINACLDELKDIMTVRRQIKVMIYPDHSHYRALYRQKGKMCQNWKKPTYW